MLIFIFGLSILIAIWLIASRRLLNNNFQYSICNKRMLNKILKLQDVLDNYIEKLEGYIEEYQLLKLEFFKINLSEIKNNERKNIVFFDGKYEEIKLLSKNNNEIQKSGFQKFLNEYNSERKELEILITKRNEIVNEYNKLIKKNIGKFIKIARNFKEKTLI